MSDPYSPSPFSDDRSPSYAGHPEFEKPKKRGVPGWAIALIVLLVVVVLLMGTCFGGLMYIGVYGLPTHVQDGPQVAEHVVDDLRDMGALQTDETLRFFYSDAVFDPRAGCYVLTDQRLVLFNEVWDHALVSVAFEDIAEIETYWSDNWLIDSTIVLVLDDGTSHSFPLSMENGGDRRFVEALREASFGVSGTTSP
ncbi:MAG: hypothetical protein AAF916_06465 [Planctomycetota bacterium]